MSAVVVVFIQHKLLGPRSNPRKALMRQWLPRDLLSNWSAMADLFLTRVSFSDAVMGLGSLKLFYCCKLVDL